MNAVGGRRAFEPGRIRLVIFDLAGTTVRDGRPGTSLVVEVLRETLRDAGVVVDEEAITARRGRDKRDTIRELLERQRPGGTADDDEVTALLDRALARLDARVSEMSEVPGARATFGFLHERGIGVAIGTGFPQDLMERVVARFGWREAGLLDYLVSSETVGAGRPDPAMIRDAMDHFGLLDPGRVLKVGDTLADIHEGRNAGAWTAAVLTGTQRRATLEAAGPDFVLASVADLPGLFGGLVAQENG